MRAFQFWVLLLASSFVSVLMIKEIFLSRQLNLAERVYVDNQQTASTATGYEQAWKQLAVRIFESSRQDPLLADVLKNEKVEIHPNASTGAPTAPATTPGAPSTPAKAPVPPPHPTTP
jgi:hypothetical protein